MQSFWTCVTLSEKLKLNIVTFGDVWHGRTTKQKVLIIKKQDRFFYRFNGTIIIEIAECDNLTEDFSWSDYIA